MLSRSYAVSIYVRTYVCTYVQWNLSIVGTIGTQLAVLYREVSLIQRLICTQLYVVEAALSVLIREVPFIQSVLYREVPLYRQACMYVL